VGATPVMALHRGRHDRRGLGMTLEGGFVLAVGCTVVSPD
jgi:hypothetical protein